MDLDETVSQDENAAPVTEEPVAPQPAVADAPPSADAPAEPEEAKRTPWFQKRIDDLTREKYDLRERLEAALKGPPAPAAAGDPGETAPPVQPADFNRAVEAVADQRVAARLFLEQCNNVYTEGTKAFPGKFQEALGNLNAAGVVNPEKPAFLEAVIATEAPERVLMELGNKPEEAMRLAALPPTQMAIALDRMSRDLKAVVPKSSDAPPPIAPISGSRTTKPFDPADTSTDMKAWVANREKQLAARKA